MPSCKEIVDIPLDAPLWTRTARVLHLLGCAACREYARQLDVTVRVLRALRRASTPDRS